MSIEVKVLNMKNAIVKGVNIVDKVMFVVEVLVAIVTGTIIIADIFYATIGRYTNLWGASEEVELTTWMYIVMVFIGSSLALRLGDHPNVTLIPRRLGRRYQTLIYVIDIVVLGVILYATQSLPRIYWAQKTQIMKIPSGYYYYYPIIVGCSFMIVRYILKIIKLYLR
uniref:TRAP transporter small permease n=1 Tax=Ignisphaera aggregans TaxID=334771 RepID=A0A7C2Z882_9CREN